MSRLSVRILLVMALFVAFATAGCGGGGGGNSGGGTTGGGGASNPNLATVTGSIFSKDDNKPVVGATVTIPGASPVQTGSNGQFTVTNVPLTATGLTVSLITTGTGYSNTANYAVSGVTTTLYDLTNTAKPLPLFAPGTALTAGQSLTLPQIMIFGSFAVNSNNPPAPPVP